jgi:hypothetical protein
MKKSSRRPKATPAGPSLFTTAGTRRRPSGNGAACQGNGRVGGQPARGKVRCPVSFSLAGSEALEGARVAVGGSKLYLRQRLPRHANSLGEQLRARRP